MLSGTYKAGRKYPRGNRSYVNTNFKQPFVYCLCYTPAVKSEQEQPPTKKILKHHNELRDPIHIFVHFDSDERRVLDSLPLQRLRYIHQLALSYLIYPGATHRRFEHCLGVMELAGRVFDVVTAPENVTDRIRTSLPEIKKINELQYWRRVVRMAALCHDVGHLPFSHAAEKELLPAGWDHERLTWQIIYSDEMQEIWRKVTPPLRADDIVKVALGLPKQNLLIFQSGRKSFRRS